MNSLRNQTSEYVEELINQTSEYVEGLETEDMRSDLSDFIMNSVSAIGGAVIAVIVLFGCLCLLGVSCIGPRSGSHFSRA